MTRTTINDFQPALESLDKLCEKYKAKDEHGPKWERQSALIHLQHAKAHLDTLMQSIRPMGTTVYNFEDFQSLAFRALAALAQTLEALEISKEKDLDFADFMKLLTAAEKPATRATKECPIE